MNETLHQTDTLIIGAGLAGIVTALELLERGQRVLLLDAGPRSACGGQANDAFGGLLLSETPEQKRNGILDNPELFLTDWQRAARFSPDAHWAQRWATEYVAHNRVDVYDWLTQHGIRFFPAVQWVERGNQGDGNSVPRYHVAWGCGRGVASTLAERLFNHPRHHLLTSLFEHRVEALERQNGAANGCHGRHRDGTFRVLATNTVICTGGIGGDPARVRHHWDTALYGPCPKTLLIGTPPCADGALHDQVQAVGGQVVNLHQMWNYAAGIRHPQPQYPDHGLSLIPPRSALWLDAHGRRIGPQPLVTGFDTHDLCKRIGHLPGQYSWQLMNWRIAIKEMAVSGTDTNPLFRDRKMAKLIWQTLTGNKALVRWMLNECPDVVSADSLEALAERMNALGPLPVDVAGLRADVEAYDDMLRRGPALHNDDQLRRLAQLRQWRSDRMRTCKNQPILDAKAGPLIAIREHLISRKSMGGMLTDLHSRVLNAQGQPLPGLYAAGEAAGFGGGGISGIRSLEGTFLSNCILNGRRAAQAIAGG